MKAELLAPAGSYESLVAAVSAGADAVYIGGAKFGARAYANNLDQDTMLSAIDYVHLHGKKIYMTVNTLLKDKEMEEELYHYLLPYYERGLDAVIVQDMGVIRFVRKAFPDLHVHVSTQMSISGAAGAMTMQELGVTRVVTARELSLKEIQSIKKHCPNLEIESFIHGALCYCYSGQCLMSSMIGGRSGNRGRCAQPCRLPYQVLQNGKPLNDAKHQYPLSPKDMCTIEILPQLIESGVYSLKIEGRMKKPEYTAGIVRIYRNYLDRYLLDGTHYKVRKEDLQELYDIYNRDGFNKSYYLERNGKDMIALENRKEADGKKTRNEALFAELRDKYITHTDAIPVSGWLELIIGKPARLHVMCDDITFSAEGDVVEKAKNQPLTRDRVLTQIQKTGSSCFRFQSLEAELSEGIFVPMQQLNALRRNALDELKQMLLQKHRRMTANAPSGMDACFAKAAQTSVSNMPLFASVETKEQLDIVMTQKDVAGIYANLSLFLGKDYESLVLAYIQRCQKKEKAAYLALPYIVRDGDLHPYRSSFLKFVEQGLCGFLIRNMESYGELKQLGLQKYCILDSNLYTWNSLSTAYWQEEGVEGDTVPFELNEKELRNRTNRYSDFVIYGYTPLMMSAQCVKKTTDHCTKNSEVLTLKDRYKKEFCVKCDCNFCYNIIYNSVPTFLIKQKNNVFKTGCRRIRFAFTIESGKQVCQVLEEWQNGKLLSEKQEYTKGHFQRGVE